MATPFMKSLRVIILGLYLIDRSGRHFTRTRHSVQCVMEKKWILPAVVCIVLVVGGLGYFFWSRNAPPPVAEAPPPPPVPTPLPTEPQTLHPVPDAPVGAKESTPLPALNDSDPALLASLGDVFGAQTVKKYLLPENLVRRIVVTVDALGRPKLAPQKDPVVPVPGVLAVQGDEVHATLDAQNYLRYRPLIAVVRDLDLKRLTNVYFHFYPLFQDAYQSLGLPGHYFNDRLVEVIDSLLATPELSTPPDLVRPSVMYQFADPALEALPSGQKVLLRMGPENAAIVKAKLTELRALVTAGAPKP
jgi:hypothetical protein